GILAKPLIGDGGLERLRAGYDRMIRLRFMRLLAVVLVITVILWLTPSAHSLPPFTITPTPNTGAAGTPVTITGSQEIPSGATTPLICQVSSSPGGLISSPTCTATITVPAQGLYSVSGSFTVAGGAAAGTYTVTVTVTSTPVPSFSQSASASFTVPSATTTTSVNCGSSAINVGSSTTCTATASGASGTISGEVISWSDAGSVSFSSSTCSLSGTSCSVTVTGAGVGSASVKAS